MMERPLSYPLPRLFFSLVLVLGLSNGLYIPKAHADSTRFLDSADPVEEMDKVKAIVMPEIQKFALFAIGIGVGMMAIKSFIK